jgi:hypothetical protein
MIAAFEKYSKEIIRQTWGGAPDYLASRLSKANASRRRLFLYRRKHRDILRGSEDDSPAQSPLSSLQETYSTFSGSPQTAVNAIPLVETTAPKVIPNSQARSSVAKATTFIESQFKPATSSKAATSIGGTSIASMFSHSRLPPPPKVPKTRTQFECPYCCQLVSTSVLSKSAWR